MNEKLISVIVPIYNTENYLESCIISIINQTYRNLEIILIDDCSIDNSLKICKFFAKKDSRIVVRKNKTNSGVSATRNNGLKIAKGNYILFVDSDDIIDTELCEKALNRLISENADTVHWGYKKFNNQTGEVFYEKDAIMVNKGTIEQPEIIEQMMGYFTISYDDLYYWFQSGKSFDEAVFIKKQPAYCFRWLYTRSIIMDNGIFFREDIGYGEDIIFVSEYLACCYKVAVMDEKLSLYRDRPGSAMHKVHSLEERINSIKSQKDILRHIDKNKYDEVMNMRQGQFVLIALNGARIYSLSDFRRLMNYNCIQEAIKGVQIKTAPFKWKVAIGLLKLRFLTLYYIIIQILSAGGFEYEH